MTEKPFVLPPLPPRPPDRPVNSLERVLDGFVAQPIGDLPWMQRTASRCLRRLAKWTLHFGRVSPYLIRPWKKSNGGFRTGYAVANWVTVCLFGWYVLPTVIEGLYAYGTYPFGTYADMEVTEAYPNVKSPDTYSVHGYITNAAGQIQPVYLSLGENVWFGLLMPRYIYGQIPKSGRCTFYTYGVIIKLGAYYLLNPWIVGLKDGHCTVINSVEAAPDQ